MVKNMPKELFGKKKTFGIVSAGAGNSYGLPSYSSLTEKVQFGDTTCTGIPKQDGTCMSVSEFLNIHPKKKVREMRAIKKMRGR